MSSILLGERQIISYRTTEFPVRRKTYRTTEFPVRRKTYRTTDFPVRRKTYRTTDFPVRRKTYRTTDFPVRRKTRRTQMSVVQQANLHLPTALQKSHPTNRQPSVPRRHSRQSPHVFIGHVKRTPST